MATAHKLSLGSMLKTVLLTSLVFTVPIVGIRFLGGLEGLELNAYDDLIRRRPAEKPDDRVVIVTISDDDIEQLQQYPLHDETFATALKKLESYQPRAIGLDISRDVPQGPPAGRVRLQKVIEKSQVIVSGCLLSNKTYPGSPPAPGSPKEGVAFADIPPDPDKTIRRVALISTPVKPDKPPRTSHFCNNASPDNEVPSLSFQTALMYLQSSEINPEPNASGDIQFRQRVLKRIDSRFGGYAHADTPDYQLMINYRGAEKVFRQVPITSILSDKVDPKLLRDRVVLIGSTSRVSKDELSTPYVDTQSDSRMLPGVLVHANAVSQILSAVLDQRPLIQTWPEVVEVLWIWGWALGSGLIAFYNRRLGLLLIVLIGIGAGLWGISYSLLLTQGLWIPLVPTFIVAILTALGVRLVDLASRSGYAQALYEQLREQFQSGTGNRDRKGDYLESLVQRARAMRQGQDAADLLAMGNAPKTFATPEMRALYEQIAKQAREDVAAEQSKQQKAIAHMRTGGHKASNIQNLINRAKQTRQPTQTDKGRHSPEKPHG